MKQIIFLLVLSFASTIAKGQTDKKSIFYAISIGTGISMSTPSATPFTLQAIGAYNFNQRFSAGAGTGLSLYDGIALVPLYADIRFNIIKPRKFTPYLECASGYAFAPSKDATGGFYLSPAIGVQWAAFSRIRLHLALGYELQELKRLKSYTDPYFRYEYKEVLNHNSLTVKAGIVF